MGWWAPPEGPITGLARKAAPVPCTDGIWERYPAGPPHTMTTTPEIIAAAEKRLAELKAEVAQLERIVAAAKGETAAVPTVNPPQWYPQPMPAYPLPITPWQPEPFNPWLYTITTCDTNPRPVPRGSVTLTS